MVKRKVSGLHAADTMKVKLPLSEDCFLQNGFEVVIEPSENVLVEEAEMRRIVPEGVFDLSQQDIDWCPEVQRTKAQFPFPI